MKRIVLLLLVLFGFSFLYGQNINDNKVSFTYIQLPYKVVDENIDNYELNLDHAYLAANQDSLELHKIRKASRMATFEQLMTSYQAKKDSMYRIHLRALSIWEKAVNAGEKDSDGSELTKPAAPEYPNPPVFPSADLPLLHTDYNDSNLNQRASVEGFQKGTGGILVTISMLPIQYFPVEESTRGSGSSKVYTYSAPYILPFRVKVETPTQGVLLDDLVLDQKQYYGMKEQKSKYDHELYMMDNKAVLHKTIEANAREKGIKSVNNYINDQIGYPEKSRTIEIYSVKRHRDWDYLDVTNAYTKTTLALQSLNQDRDRSGAESYIDEAIAAYDKILSESNLSDRKARINDKITAMLQCNMTELLNWKANFNKALTTANIAENSGEGKARRHIRREKGFYADQRRRWESVF
ncbi:MAG: hypothetical protein KJP00_01355 [Bacteroidia bacterium]|nr:hypothetical protein [Bacteroidia bacterium]